MNSVEKEQARKRERIEEIRDFYMSCTDQDLEDHLKCFYPSGSGPITMMYRVSGLIEAVQQLRAELKAADDANLRSVS